jgi:hypothetical protein
VEASNAGTRSSETEEAATSNGEQDAAQKKVEESYAGTRSSEEEDAATSDGEQDVAQTAEEVRSAAAARNRNQKRGAAQQKVVVVVDNPEGGEAQAGGEEGGDEVEVITASSHSRRRNRKRGAAAEKVVVVDNQENEEEDKEDGSKSAKRSKLKSASEVHRELITASILPGWSLGEVPAHQLAVLSVTAGGDRSQGTPSSIARALQNVDSSGVVPLIPVDGIWLMATHQGGSATGKMDNVDIDLASMFCLGSVLVVTPIVASAKKKQKKAMETGLQEEYVVCGILLMMRNTAEGKTRGGCRLEAEVVLAPLASCVSDKVNLT